MAATGGLKKQRESEEQEAAGGIKEQAEAQSGPDPRKDRWDSNGE